MTSYRKLKKEFIKKKGFSVRVSLSAEGGSYLRKASQAATIVLMKRILKTSYTLLKEK